MQAELERALAVHALALDVAEEAQRALLDGRKHLADGAANLVDGAEAVVRAAEDGAEKLLDVEQEVAEEARDAAEEAPQEDGDLAQGVPDQAEDVAQDLLDEAHGVADNLARRNEDAIHDLLRVAEDGKDDRRHVLKQKAHRREDRAQEVLDVLKEAAQVDEAGHLAENAAHERLDAGEELSRKDGLEERDNSILDLGEQLADILEDALNNLADRAGQVLHTAEQRLHGLIDFVERAANRRRDVAQEMLDAVEEVPRGQLLEQAGDGLERAARGVHHGLEDVLETLGEAGLARQELADGGTDGIDQAGKLREQCRLHLDLAARHLRRVVADVRGRQSERSELLGRRRARLCDVLPRGRRHQRRAGAVLAEKRHGCEGRKRECGCSCRANCRDQLSHAVISLPVLGFALVVPEIPRT